MRQYFIIITDNAVPQKQPDSLPDALYLGHSTKMHISEFDLKHIVEERSLTVITSAHDKFMYITSALMLQKMETSEPTKEEMTAAISPLLTILKKHIPGFTEIELPVSTQFWVPSLRLWMETQTPMTTVPNLQDASILEWLEHRNISLETFLMNPKYAVIINDNYKNNTFLTMLNNGIIDKNSIENFSEIEPWL